MKDNPKQAGLDAMILYRNVVVDVSKANTDGDAESEYYRIKIFTQEGTKRGHVQVEYDKKIASVVHVEGRTIRPDGSIVKFDGQVLETTVEKSSGQKVLAKSFTLPDVEPGCIIEYRYSIQGQPGRVLDWDGSCRRTCTLAKRISPTRLTLDTATISGRSFAALRCHPMPLPHLRRMGHT
jgi:hypothetical protein